MSTKTATSKNRNRIRFDASPELKIAIKNLKSRWNMNSNDAIARAILESLHRPLTTAPEPPWALEIKKEIKDMKELLIDVWE
jgi:hypothetical protein